MQNDDDDPSIIIRYKVHGHVFLRIVVREGGLFGSLYVCMYCAQTGQYLLLIKKLIKNKKYTPLIVAENPDI